MGDPLEEGTFQLSLMVNRFPDTSFSFFFFLRWGGGGK